MKKFRYFILALVCCILVSFPVRSMAAETYGYVGTFLGDITFEETNNIIPLSASYVHDYDVDLDVSETEMNGTVVSNSTAFMTYTGNMDTRINVAGDIGTYLNGSAHTYFTFTVDDENVGQIDVSIDNDDIAGVTITAQRVAVDTNLTRLYVFFTFNNYEITGNVSYIPLHIDVQYTYRYDASVSGSIQAKWMHLGVDEWVDYITQYDDIRDLPGYYGDSSRQNQQIIDSIDENTSAVNDAASYIGNKIQYYTDLLEKSIVSSFNKLTTNLSNWYNGMTTTLTNFFTPYFDNITDAFKRALSDTQATDNEVLSGAMDDYQSAEQEVFAPAMDSLTDFDFGSNDISSLGTGFIGAITFVSSCLSNMYDLTPFSAVFDVIATLALASICIGMSRLWFGKKGR